MTRSEGTEYAKQVKGRVLFTGGMERMADDVMAHVSDKYQKLKCMPTDVSFTNALKEFRPHVIVICLLDGLSELVGTYYALEDNTDYMEIPVMVIGYDEDCSHFKRKLAISKLETFTRPLNMNYFLESLSEQISERLETVKEFIVEERKEPDDEAAFWEEKLLEVEETRNTTRKIHHASLFQGRKSILVVDDDVRMLNVIKLYLQDLYDITVVPSGKLALKFLEKRTTDLVLLDYMMPELDGPAVLQKIREGKLNADIPVLFLTGVSEKELVMKGLEFHPSGYLLKPVTRDMLLERVTAILLEI